MGSKRSLAGRISSEISDRRPGATVLDAFSGMCAVGAQVAPRHRLITNDAHSFAHIVAQAMFVAPGPPPTSLHAKDELTATYALNAAALRGAVSGRLTAEAEALARIDEQNGWDRFVALNEAELAAGYPRYPDGFGVARRANEDVEAAPYRLATAYFAFGYFGLAQAIEIDSLRYAIDRAPPDRKSYYLSALVRASSECAAAPGHFAQFLVPRDKQTSRYIARIRSRSILDRFYRALDTFPDVPCAARGENLAYCSDATSLLNQLKEDGGVSNLVVYADPPYSRAQYSRYYHVLETLVRYDYPACASKGRYRDDRFRTGFSLRSGVAAEMETFIGGVADLGASLFLSYPSNGLFHKAGGDLESTLRKYFAKVTKVASEPLNHSTLGGAPGVASVTVTEDVFYGCD